MSNATQNKAKQSAPLSSLDIIQASGQANNLSSVAGNIQRITADYGRLKGKVVIVSAKSESLDRKTKEGSRSFKTVSSLTTEEDKRYQACLKFARAFQTVSGGVWILDEAAKQASKV
jgi:hypothetical protein